MMLLQSNYRCCEIIIYDGDDFSGWSARLGGGNHSLDDINANSRPVNCGGTTCNDLFNQGPGLQDANSYDTCSGSGAIECRKHHLDSHVRIRFVSGMIDRIVSSLAPV